MKILDVKKLDKGLKGISVSAQLLNCYEVKEFTGKYGAFEKQTIQLIEENEKIFCRIGSDFVSKADIGKTIILSELTVDEFKGEKNLECTKKTTISVEGGITSPTAQPAKETTAKQVEGVKVPKSFDDIVTECAEEVMTIVGNGAFQIVLEEGLKIGLSPEDVRAMFISRTIQRRV